MTLQTNLLLPNLPSLARGRQRVSRSLPHFLNTRRKAPSLYYTTYIYIRIYIARANTQSLSIKYNIAHTSCSARKPEETRITNKSTKLCLRAPECTLYTTLGCYTPHTALKFIIITLLYGVVYKEKYIVIFINVFQEQREMNFFLFLFDSSFFFIQYKKINKLFYTIFHFDTCNKSNLLQKAVSAINRSDTYFFSTWIKKNAGGVKKDFATRNRSCSIAAGSSRNL